HRNNSDEAAEDGDLRHTSQWASLMRCITGDYRGTLENLAVDATVSAVAQTFPHRGGDPDSETTNGESCPLSSTGSTGLCGRPPSSTCASAPVSTSRSARERCRSDRSLPSSPRCSAARAP